MRKIVSLAGILCAISIVATGALASVFNLTEPVIIAGQLEEKNQAMTILLPDVIDNNFSDAFKVDEGTVTAYNIGYAKDEIVGYVISVVVSGYGDKIEMMVGMDTNGHVTGVEVLSHSETAGLGAKLEEESFLGQFRSKTGPFTVVKTTPVNDNDIVSITASTITSNAVVTGINDALFFYETQLKGVK